MTNATVPSVGVQIRKIRTEKGLSIRALAARCGMSANAISLIERGENSPTVSSLHLLAQALGVSITDFFEMRHVLNAVYVQRNNGIRYRSKSLELESLGTGLPDQQLEPFRLTIEPGSETVSEPISHPGHEFVYCLEGEISYYVDGQQYLLQTGDSLLLDATFKHGWRNDSQAPARILIIFQAVHEIHLAHQSHLDRESPISNI